MSLNFIKPYRYLSITRFKYKKASFLCCQVNFLPEIKNSRGRNFRHGSDGTKYQTPEYQYLIDYV